ncbi:hypothetical protein V1O62_30330 [Pseudomonas aeruginosa]|uniref:hypothetical protein n=1 Tax=Pseudomonas aeruginosa TaxID=287 RepID=UPI0015E39D89|nr:hypothetical protein [Pseudomonas aeruginosa]HBN8007462.1 hypothetical protein [Pseudomonas aeruginosa]HBN9210954.1 hypothetical protein [Pseudomonas aeruginosa]HCH0510988.1 hypothetical protein [Pseudomonas aeruginosa]
MSDRNNARTIEGIREKIREIADSKTLLDAQEQHAYRLGWIGALYGSCRDKGKIHSLRF